MTDRDALFRQILLHPLEETPRLVYADWLEERGEAERAEFIRVQCELQRRRTDFENGRVPEHVHFVYEWQDWCQPLWDRERELLMPKGSPDDPDFIGHRFGDGVNAQWFDRLYRDLVSLGGVWRGFVSFIECDWPTFLNLETLLIWSPKQTIECPECRGAGESCTRCMASGRIPRPFPATIEPVRSIRITEPEVGISENTTIRRDETGAPVQFNRMACPKCGIVPPQPQAIPQESPLCCGLHVNFWKCDRWDVVFQMPEAEYFEGD